MFLFRSSHESHHRSIAKAISWRALGSVDTFALSWFFTGSAGAAGAIASTEMITKMILYYVHERAWSAIHWGFTDGPPPGGKPSLTEIVEEGGQ
jgi:uncharacterized membrane protein